MGCTVQFRLTRGPRRTCLACATALVAGADAEAEALLSRVPEYAARAQRAAQGMAALDAQVERLKARAARLLVASTTKNAAPKPQ